MLCLWHYFFMNSSEKSTSEQIDDIVGKTGDWRGVMLAKLRTAITQVSPDIGEEVKWKKPSKPEGIPVWVYNGKNICMADTLKNAVRLTFPKGAQLKDPAGFFNTRLDSKTVRAVDFYEGTSIDVDSMRSLILEALKIV
jgi:hypothetical protein